MKKIIDEYFLVWVPKTCASWIGAQKVLGKYYWFTETGSIPMSHSYFGQVEPNGDGSCIHDMNQDNSYKWNDLPCSYKLSSYCEKLI